METAGQIPSPTTRIHVGDHVVPTSTPPNAPTPGISPSLNCEHIELKYDVALAVISGVSFVFGVFYCFFGYRLFRVSMFLTGFIFGSLVTYLICMEENVLGLEGKIGVSLIAGVLCGLITMLVRYVGLFMTGFHLGLLLAVAILITMEQFYHPSTKWIPIGIIFGIGLLFALLNLYFQKGLTIIGTSLFGGALMTVGLDYYVEMFILVRYAWYRIKAEPGASVCWFSWLIITLWPAAMLVGIVTQVKVTSKGTVHKETIQPPRARRRHKINMDVERERYDAHKTAVQKREVLATTTPSFAGTIHTKYRQLYQIRRVNGDVIAQSFLQNIQDQLSPQLQSLTVANTDDDGASSSNEHSRGAS